MQKRSLSSKKSSGLVSLDIEVGQIIRRYSYGSALTLIAIPVPGVDMAATYVLWGKMILEIAHLYDKSVTAEDARALGIELFRSVILTTVAWFASAKTASEILKFFPGAGTFFGYILDATIAGLGAKKITSALGYSAAVYYKSGHHVTSDEIVSEVGKILKDPSVVSALLATVKSKSTKK